MATHYFDPLKKIQSLDTIILRDLTDRAYRVFSFLVFRYNSHTEQCNPSVNYMAAQMNKSLAFKWAYLKSILISLCPDINATSGMLNPFSKNLEIAS